MKILYISSLIFKKGSSASIRNCGLIKGLQELDNSVDLLTIKYVDEMEDEYLIQKIQKNTKIYKSELNILSSYLKNKKLVITNNKFLLFIKNLIKDIIFFPDVDKEWLFAYKNHNIDINNYDLVISSSDTKTSHFIADKMLKINKNIKWIQIWGDPWADDIGISILKKIRIFISERKIINKADKVLYVSPLTLEKMKRKMLIPSLKLGFIPRGYLEEIRSSDLKKENELVFTYTGILNKNRNIIPFLEKLNKYLRENSYSKIKLKIYGMIDNNTKNKLLNYTFVKYYGIVDFKEIISIYKKSDILIFIDNGKNTTQIPGKIYDYLGTDKKIVALFNNKNDIYNYFKEKLDILTMTNNEIDINKILKYKNRNINTKFSNKEIAKNLLEKVR